MSDVSDAKKYVAEFIGTFVWVFVGCGSAVFFLSILGHSTTAFVLSVLGTSLAIGLSVLAMVYAIGGISGCHINPAVSLSMLAAGKMKVVDTAIYIVMQCLGATVSAAVLYFVASGSPVFVLSSYGLGQNGYETASIGEYSMLSAFVAELILTFIFVLVIHGVTSEKTPKGFAGIAIGLTLVLVHIVGTPITGTSVNPARSLGPALIFFAFAGETAMTAIRQLWLFWAAPIIGALLAAGVWRALRPKPTATSPETDQ